MSSFLEEGALSSYTMSGKHRKCSELTPTPEIHKLLKYWTIRPGNKYLSELPRSLGATRFV